MAIFDEAWAGKMGLESLLSEPPKLNQHETNKNLPNVAPVDNEIISVNRQANLDFENSCI